MRVVKYFPFEGWNGSWLCAACARSGISWRYFFSICHAINCRCFLGVCADVFHPDHRHRPLGIGPTDCVGLACVDRIPSSCRCPLGARPTDYFGLIRVGRTRANLRCPLSNVRTDCVGLACVGRVRFNIRCLHTIGSIDCVDLACVGHTRSNIHCFLGIGSSDCVSGLACAGHTWSNTDCPLGIGPTDYAGLVGGGGYILSDIHRCSLGICFNIYVGVVSHAYVCPGIRRFFLGILPLCSSCLIQHFSRYCVPLFCASLSLSLVFDFRRNLRGTKAQKEIALLNTPFFKIILSRDIKSISCSFNGKNKG